MLTPDDHARIRDAVDKAEKEVSAEIVPCIFSESGHYPESIWGGAAAGAALAASALIVADFTQPLLWPLWKALLCVPIAGVLGAALSRWVPAFKRFFVGAHHLDETVARRAKEVFFDRGLDRTKARDGVLIFASLLERRAVVLADESVRARVPREAWTPVVDALTAAAARGRIGDGLVAAVEEAAKVLAAAGLTGSGGGELGDDAVEEDGA